MYPFLIGTKPVKIVDNAQAERVGVHLAEFANECLSQLQDKLELVVFAQRKEDQFLGGLNL